MRRQINRFLSYLKTIAGFSFWLVLVGANGAHASALSDLAASMQPGTWAILSTSGFNNGKILETATSGSAITQFANSAAWDSNTRRFLFIGSPHYEPYKFAIYKDSNNSWEAGPPLPGIAFSTVLIGHGYNHNTIDARNGDFYYRPYNSRSVYKYNTAGTWIRLPDIPSTSLQCCGGLEYFPERNGLYFLDGDSGLFFYSSATNQWTKISNTLAGIASYHNFMEYDHVHKVILMGGGNGSTAVYKIDQGGTVVRVANAPIALGVNNALTTIDPVTGKLLVFKGNSSYQYDVATNAWSQFNSGNSPLATFGDPVFDTIVTPIDTYGVIMFVKYYFDQSKVYLYKHSTSSSSTPPPTDTAAPSIPTGVTAVATSSSQISVSWTASADNVGVAGYRIFRQGTQVATTTATSYVDSGLSPSTTYSYAVAAYDLAGNVSSQSAVANATTQGASALPPPSSGAIVALIDFGSSSSSNIFGLAGWSTAIKDIYTDYQNIGPGGTTIVVGSNHTYNYQGVTGTSRSFTSGEKIRATWYNNSSASRTFTPNISFTDADRIGSGISGTWYAMTQVTVPPFGSATSEYAFTSGTAGSYSLVNVNVNYTNSTEILADKIELIPVGSAPSSFDFSLANTGSKSVTQGQSISNSITATLVSGTTVPTGFAVSGLPSGAAGTFSQTSCSPSCTTTLNISTLSSTPTGSYSITISAVAGSLTRTSAFALTINSSSTSPPTGSSDFQDRCSQAGVLKCVSFDNASDLAGRWGSVSGIFTGTVNPTLDTSIKASGPSSLKFTIPSNSGSSASGSYFTNFTDNRSTLFGEGDEFYIQWRQRFSPEFLSTNYTGGGGWKQAIIGEGDVAGVCDPANPTTATCPPSCTQLEIVAQNTAQRGIPQMYHSCGGKDGRYEPLEYWDNNLGNVVFQNAVGCLYGSGFPEPPCVRYKANQWMTFQVHIKIGTWYKNNGTYRGDSTIRMWVADEGQPSKLVIDFDPATGHGYDIANTDTTAPLAKYGKIWLLPYHTGKDSSQAHPTAFTWYY